MVIHLELTYAQVCRRLEQPSCFPCFFYPPGDARPELIYFRRASFDRMAMSDDEWGELYRDWEQATNPGPADEPFFANWLQLEFYLPGRGELGRLRVVETEAGQAVVSLHAVDDLRPDLIPYLDRIGEVVLRSFEVRDNDPMLHTSDAPSPNRKAAVAREVRADASWRLHQLRRHRAEIFRQTGRLPKWSDACATIGIDASTVRKHDPELARRWGDLDYGDLVVAADS
jgi:hypothetical protein